MPFFEFCFKLASCETRISAGMKQHFIFITELFNKISRDSDTRPSLNRKLFCLVLFGFSYALGVMDMGQARLVEWKGKVSHHHGFVFRQAKEVFENRMGK